MLVDDPEHLKVLFLSDTSMGRRFKVDIIHYMDSFNKNRIKCFIKRLFLEMDNWVLTKK